MSWYHQVKICLTPVSDLAGVGGWYQIVVNAMYLSDTGISINGGINHTRFKVGILCPEGALTAIQIGIFKWNLGAKICRQWIKTFGIRNNQRPKK